MNNLIQAVNARLVTWLFERGGGAGAGQEEYLYFRKFVEQFTATLAAFFVARGDP